ncbi:hypothetical protein [Phenylobacterium sp.]|uniref:lysozyme inhibitor LprI family protein n=1 Tax=Phenylobacterium sp. TaxID=1871053 RepID=UPI0030F3842B
MTIETPPLAPTVSSPSRLEAAMAAFAKPMVLAGVGGACVLGLALGLLARPQLAPDSRTPGSMQPVEQVQIQIDQDEPLPAVEGGKLELLPAGTPRVTGAVKPPAPPVSDVEAPSRSPGPRAQGPSFDCTQSASAAEELVCNDAELAAQDRTLAASWRRALDSGIPAWRLRRQQQRWLDAREDAARNAPDEVADLYDQRIQELDEAAMYGR